MSSIEVAYYLEPGAKPPYKKIWEDAGWDLSGNFEGRMVFEPGDCKKISLGIVLDSPEGLQWFLDVRSSIGARGLSLMCRVVDSSYRGVLSAVICNCSNQTTYIDGGERICQMVPMPFTHGVGLVQRRYTDEFRKTERGSDGFGSSGRFIPQST